MTTFASHLGWIDQEQPQMIKLLQSWASINTGSNNVAGINGFIHEIQPVLARLGAPVEEIALLPQVIINDGGETESRPLGPALSIRSPERPGPRVLLMIHTDTVFGIDHPFQTVSRVNDNVLRGPGACDAKGGLIVMLFALLALERSPFASGLAWEVLLNPDEELGSPGSSTLISKTARRNDIALLFEPALPDGALVSSRKGSGNFTFVVRGRAAHAGRDLYLGRNSIHALAALVTKLAALQEQIPGIGVNTGWIHGGGPVNIVPDRALCRLNVRVENAEQQKSFESQLEEILKGAASLDGIQIEPHGGFRCPPKPLTPTTERLLQQLQDCAVQLGLPLTWRATGGVCDGNRTAAAGVPTVDSLGVRGGNIHTDQEFVFLDSLAERAKLTTLFLMRLAVGELTIERRGAGLSKLPPAEVSLP